MASGQIALVVAALCLGVFHGDRTVATDDEPSEKGCSNPADIVFVLDESGSIWGPHFTKQLEFVEHVVDAFDVRPGRTHIGVLTFGTDVRVIFNVGQISSESELKERIKGISQMRGETYTHDALQRLRADMFSDAYARPGVPHIAIVITDGESNYPELTAAEANRVHEQGIQVFAIGVGRDVVKAELEAIASATDMVFEVDDYSVLDQLRQRLAWEACHVTTLPPPPPTTTTTAPPPPQMIEGCTGYRPMDHIWAIPDQADAAQTRAALDLIRDVTSDMTLSATRVQVGVTPRVCQAGPAIRLRDHDTQEGFNEALARRQYTASANSDAHIRYIVNQGMSAASGGRPDCVKFGVLIIDGRHGANLARTLSEARRARDAGIRLIVIGVGAEPVTSELNAIAASTDDVIRVSGYEELQGVSADVIDRLCHGLMASESLHERYIYIKRFFNVYEY